MLETHGPDQMAKAGELIRKDYSERYWPSTQKTMRTQYAKRDPHNGSSVEDVNDIIHRVALAVAIAEIKYLRTPSEIIQLTLAEVIQNPVVVEWANRFADDIGMQRWWANTPANINADPEISLMVLKYEAHGILAGLELRDIWLQSTELRKQYLERKDTFENRTHSAVVKHKHAMGKLAHELHGKGCLAACGVAYVTDSLEGIQEAARIEALAAKASMGMGLNTSKLRPWSSITSGGASASGPDRFYEKSIAKAVEAVAQGGRRGGALIELRNSDHPDILFFIDKKKLLPEPDVAQIFIELKTLHPTGHTDRELFDRAVKEYGRRYYDYLTRQNYLSNTNITVIAMPGFMEAVKQGEWYQCSFEGKPWYGAVYDPRKPTGKVNEQTKEPIFDDYSVDLSKYPSAGTIQQQMKLPQMVVNEGHASLRGWVYAPEVLDRIIENMRDSGEPGIMFYDLVNNANGNAHIYDLDTCNPCGEQALPAGIGKDKNTYMGTCNLSSLHAAHADFWHADGTYNHQAMQAATHRQQRFMDNVTDVSWYPVPIQNATARLERRNGGGFAGIAEFLSRSWLRFGTEEANNAVAALFKWYTEASLAASVQMAGQRGTYPLWEGSGFHKDGLPVRNACLVNNAPTGTLAQMMQTSWGVDPHNGIVFSRTVRTQKVDFTAPGFADAMAFDGAADRVEDVIKTIRSNAANMPNKILSCKGVDGVPSQVQDAFPIRVEVSPEDYIRHLAACFRGANEVCAYAMNSISNTCSIPEKFDPKAIKDAVILAYELGVKDLTFYPDGSRLSQPVQKIAADLVTETPHILDLLNKTGQTSGTPLEPVNKTGGSELETSPPVRRHVDIHHTYGPTFKVKIGAPDGIKTLHVSLNHEPGKPGQLIEVYARMGKNGDAGPFEAIGRLASAFLQFAAQFGEEQRMEAENSVVRQLIDIQSGHPIWHMFPGREKAELITSACDGIAKAILQYRTTQYTQVQTRLTPAEVLSGCKSTAKRCNKCNDGELIKTDGCWNCTSCGDSKCG